MSEPPEPKPTVKMAAQRPPSDRSLAEETLDTVKRMADNLGDLSQSVVMLHSRVTGVEARVAQIESPSRRPPALNSTRVQAIIDEHPSRMDLETASRQAEEIAKGNARDVAIAETRKLAEDAAKELAKQSRAMGLGVTTLRWFATKEGAFTMMRIATTVGAVYAALKASGVLK